MAQTQYRRKIKCELYNDNYQNWKSYPMAKAQLIISDVPYNIGDAAYGSNPMWYNGGDNANGESQYAKSSFFRSDGYFKPAEFMHFVSQLLRKEPNEKVARGKSSDAPCMILFCAFEQTNYFIELAKQYGFQHYKLLTFIKNYSPQVLKANMRVCGATEYALLLWRDKLPKFRNDGQMIFDWFQWERDGKEIPKLHSTQKPVKLLKRLISIYTDPGDVVIDPCAGSGSTLRAAYELGRNSYGFEIDRDMYKKAKEQMLSCMDEAPLFEETWEQEAMAL